MDDLALINAWIAGDRRAGDGLLRRHIPALHRFFANKVGVECDDLVQRTILSCLKTKDGFSGRGSFRTYLFTVARRQLFRHYERRGRVQGEDWSATLCVDELSETPSQAVARREQEQHLLLALRRLPLQLQIAIELHYFEELSTEQLAEVLAIPQGTVKSRLRRGRDALATQLKRQARREVAEETVSTLADWMHRIRAVIDE